ncbi:MAG: hypothetical protein NVSMB63_18280 [Sediminibacterium sp.]
MEAIISNPFSIAVRDGLLVLTNHEGILYTIPIRFLSKETNIGDHWVSYQLLRLKRSGLFSIEQLYQVAAWIEEKQPESLIDWTATFMLLQNDSGKNLLKHLKAFHLA